MAANPIFAVLSILLFFLVPGYLFMRALWPEKRARGEKAMENVLVLFTGSVVCSTALTIIIGFYLGNAGLFAATQSAPTLEAILGVLSLAFLFAGVFRGAYSRSPPTHPARGEDLVSGEDDTEAFLERIELISREERRLRHRLRVAKKEGSSDVDRITEELSQLVSSRKELEKEREGMFAQ